MFYFICYQRSKNDNIIDVWIIGFIVVYVVCVMVDVYIIIVFYILYHIHIYILDNYNCYCNYMEIFINIIIFGL